MTRMESCNLEWSTNLNATQGKAEPKYISICYLSPQMNRVTVQSYKGRKRAKMTQRHMSKIFEMKYLTSIPT